MKLQIFVLSIGVDPDHIGIEFGLQLRNLLRICSGTDNHLTLAHLLQIAHQLRRERPDQLLNLRPLISIAYQDVIKIDDNNKLFTFMVAHYGWSYAILFIDILSNKNLHLLNNIDQITHVNSLLLIARVDGKRIASGRSEGGGHLLLDVLQRTLEWGGVHRLGLDLVGWWRISLEAGGVKLLWSLVVVSTLLQSCCDWWLHHHSLLLFFWLDSRPLNVWLVLLVFLIVSPLISISIRLFWFIGRSINVSTSSFWLTTWRLLWYIGIAQQVTLIFFISIGGEI